MAKKDIINNGLWETYSDEVQKRMTNPRYRGEITQQEADTMGARLVVADWGAESCGDAVRLYWAVDPQTERVVAARFKSFGCGTAIASTDMMAELTVGKTIAETLKITNLEVEKALRTDPAVPAVPPQKMHCSVMAYDVIKKAVSLYRNVDMESLEKEKIICECARVTLSMVEDAIRINNLTTIEQITQYTKAGGYCKSCIAPGGHEKRDIYLVDLLEKAKRERAAAAASRTSSEDFASMSLVRKMKFIEKAVQNKVAPVLAADGGSIEVNDLVEENGSLVLYVQYGGACKFCPSSQTGTLSFVERMINEALPVPVQVRTM
jgi:NifU-like protein